MTKGERVLMYTMLELIKFTFQFPLNLLGMFQLLQEETVHLTYTSTISK